MLFIQQDHRDLIIQKIYIHKKTQVMTGQVVTYILPQTPFKKQSSTTPLLF